MEKFSDGKIFEIYSPFYPETFLFRIKKIKFHRFRVHLLLVYPEYREPDSNYILMDDPVTISGDIIATMNCLDGN